MELNFILRPDEICTSRKAPDRKQNHDKKGGCIEEVDEQELAPLLGGLSNGSLANSETTQPKADIRIPIQKIGEAKLQQGIEAIGNGQRRNIRNNQDDLSSNIIILTKGI